MQGVMGHFTAEFDRLDLKVDLPDVVQKLTEERLIEVIGDYDGVIAGDDEFTAAVIESAPRLRVISKWGVGMDNIDLAAAAASGIMVTNTPGVFGEEVADVALGYLISLARRLHVIDRLVRQGEWPRIEGEGLRGKSVGIIGFGSIGRALAGRARACGMDVVISDVDPHAVEAAREIGVRAVAFRELLQSATFVVVACSLTPANVRMIGRAEFQTLKRGSYLINVSRGGLLDEAAVVEALVTEHLAGAALDVFEEEPLPEDSQLRDLPNCILGSHNASSTREAILRTSEAAFHNLLVGLGLQTEREPAESLSAGSG
jgi:D-3-phosphoglycerate dehydrogenase / 2-oxoglutarate reductase